MLTPVKMLDTKEFVESNKKTNSELNAIQPNIKAKQTKIAITKSSPKSDNFQLNLMLS